METNDIKRSIDDVINQKLEPLNELMRDIKSLMEKNGNGHDRIIEEMRSLRELIESSNLIRREKIAMFVDSQNLYYSARAAFASKVNYEKLLRLVTGNRTLVRAIAYIVQPPDGDVKPFATSLERIGYIVKIKDVRTRSDGSAKANWDMGIALDILGIIDAVDTIALASGDGDFVALLDFVKAKNKRVEVFSFSDNTAYDLKEKADRFEPLGENVILNLT